MNGKCELWKSHHTNALLKIQASLENGTYVKEKVRKFESKYGNTTGFQKFYFQDYNANKSSQVEGLYQRKNKLLTSQEKAIQLDIPSSIPYIEKLKKEILNEKHFIPVMPDKYKREYINSLRDELHIDKMKCLYYQNLEESSREHQSSKFSSPHFHQEGNNYVYDKLADDKKTVLGKENRQTEKNPLIDTKLAIRKKARKRSNQCYILIPEI